MRVHISRVCPSVHRLDSQSARSSVVVVVDHSSVITIGNDSSFASKKDEDTKMDGSFDMRETAQLSETCGVRDDFVNN